MKWMMGWMHDTLEYFKLDPLTRQQHQHNFTLSMDYYYKENFMLALSHDEVVYGKLSMLEKMPGDASEKFANLRLLYSYMFTHPGGKLLFMGNEFGSNTEWNYKSELPWELMQYEPHQKLSDCVKDLNGLLRGEPALYEKQFDKDGFEWTNIAHPAETVIVYRRKGVLPQNDLLIILHLVTGTKRNWKIETLGKDSWSVIYNSNAVKYGGAGETVLATRSGMPLGKQTTICEIIVDLHPCRPWCSNNILQELFFVMKSYIFK